MLTPSFYLKPSKEIRSSKEYETYLLFLEYLKRNEDYKEFCEFARNLKIPKDGWREITKIFPKKFFKKPGNRVFCSRSFLHKRLDFAARVLYPNTKSECHVVDWSIFQELVEIYSNHGDIFKDKCIEFPITPRNPHFQSVRQLSIEPFSMREELLSMAKIFKDVMKKEISIDEYINFYHRKDNPTVLYLRVHFYGVENIDNLCSLFRKILKERKKDLPKRKDIRIRLDELRRYLDVHDYFCQGLGWEEIAEKIDFYRNRIGENVRIAIYDDRAKAKRIISNAGKGQFPGPH